MICHLLYIIVVLSIFLNSCGNVPSCNLSHKGINYYVPEQFSSYNFIKDVLNVSNIDNERNSLYYSNDSILMELFVLDKEFDLYNLRKNPERELLALREQYKDADFLRGHIEAIDTLCSVYFSIYRTCSFFGSDDLVAKSNIVIPNSKGFGFYIKAPYSNLMLFYIDEMLRDISFRTAKCNTI